MIKAGIFDVGGVLISWDGRYLTDDIKNTLKISDEQFTTHWSRLVSRFDTGQISEDEFWQEFIKATGTNEALPDTPLFLREFKKRYHPNKEVLKVVRELDEKGMKLAVLSNTITSHTAFLQEQGIYSSFPITVFSQEVGLAKPDPAIYELTLHKLKLQPEQAFFVDDRPENIETARNLGMHGIVFENAKKLREAIRGLGVLI